MLGHPIDGPDKITGTPLKLSLIPGLIERLTAMSGEHNDAIFHHLLGYSREEIQLWNEAGVL